MRFWLFVMLAAGVVGCGRAAPRGGPIPAYRPPAFRADIGALIGDKRYEDAVTYLKSADPVQQAKHDGDGYLAVGEDMIVLPGVDEAVLFEDTRDWMFPGTQDAIQDAAWQRAATDFAARYNQARRGSTGMGRPDATHLEDLGIAHFVRLGATVRASEEGTVDYLFLADRELTATDLNHLAALRRLRELDLSDCRVDDAIWAATANLHELRTLVLWGSQISDEGLVYLRNFPELVSLDLRGTQIGDEGLVSVARECPNLESLDLLQTRVTSNGVALLTALKRLQKLSLVYTSVDNDGLDAVGAIVGLTELSLEGTAITDEGIAHLESLVNLRLLSIHGNEISEKCLVYLEELQELETLYLCCPVTDVGVQSLQKLMGLRWLMIGECMTLEAREALETKLNGVGVE